MPLIVADASIVVKALVPDRDDEADADRALILWHRVHEGEDALLQPPHWLAEVGAVISRLSPATAERDVVDLHSMGIPVLDSAEVYRTASRLSVELQRHLFDTLYHAVALESEGATLVTADERYYRKAAGWGGIILLADHSG